MPTLVSVIVPVHNGERFLGEALDAISAQTYRATEVIVVDDGSVDDSAAVADAFIAALGRGIVHRQARAGVAAARNAGLDLASGELVALCDHDDVWFPEKLERQVTYLLRHPATGAVLVRQEPFFDGIDTPPNWLQRDHVFGDLGGVLPCTMLVRRDVFDVIGSFDRSRQGADDLDWLFRAKRAGIGVETIPEILVRRRVHAANASHDARLVQAGLLRSLRDLVRDQRGG